MRQIFIVILSILLFTSCSTDDVPAITKEQELLMDSLSKVYYSNISIGTSKDFLKFSKPYELEITLEGRSISMDSLQYIATVVSEKFYPTLQKNEKYKSIIVKFNIQPQEQTGAGSEMSYTFDLSSEKK
ncbi:MAG: hypothetical protein GXC73_00710 [Chitinophagaceae bacterium]|nr:hypothetical protein [Chitinophagaceae bacterium]